MYHFSYFKEKDKTRILDFLSNHPFAFLTGSTSSGSQVATQIPILIEEREGELYLQGHIMRKTDHHKAFADNPQALVVFTGRIPISARPGTPTPELDRPGTI
jgi:transcriptional regulator